MPKIHIDQVAGTIKQTGTDQGTTARAYFQLNHGVLEVGCQRCAPWGSLVAEESFLNVFQSIFSTCRSAMQASIRRRRLCVPPCGPVLLTVTGLEAVPLNLTLDELSRAGANRINKLGFAICSASKGPVPVPRAFVLKP